MYKTRGAITIIFYNSVAVKFVTSTRFPPVDQKIINYLKLHYPSVEVRFRDYDIQRPHTPKPTKPAKPANVD
jgi:hypothetical protein